MTTPHVARSVPQRHTLARDLILVLGGSILIALSAQIALPIPFSPVPVTGQTFAVLLVGALLGRWRGAAAVMAYLTEGALGLPVFAGGAAGIARLVGPTAGYLVGFAGGAWLVGYLAESGWTRRAASAAVSMALGSAVILTCGALWLALFVGIGDAFRVGLLPFLVGDALKIAVAAAVLPPAARYIGRR